MPYELNAFFQFDNRYQSNSRILVYPNQEIAAKLLNHAKERGAHEITVAECIPKDASRLPMPHVLMESIDRIIRNQSGYSVVIGLDAYLSLLETKSMLMNELRSRLDKYDFHVDYLLSGNFPLKFAPRYEEARKIVFLRGTEETPIPLRIRILHKQWAKSGEGIIGFHELLRKLDPFNPGGEHTAFLPDISSGQPELGKAVTFVTNIHDIAIQLYGFDIHLDDAVLERLLLNCIWNNQEPDSFLRERFGEENCNPRLALKRLLMLQQQQDELWPAYAWYLRKLLPKQSYMVKVLSDTQDPEKLLWNYAVGTTLSVLSDVNAEKYASERSEALKAIGSDMQIEPFIIDFITAARDRGDALQFLNCGTFSEKVEIVRRASEESFSDRLPRLYGELYPILADYLSPYDWGNNMVADYFQEYRRLKLSDTLTDTFMLQAYNAFIPSEIPTRDSVLESLRKQKDTALLVVDAFGVEYLPALTAMAKRCGLNFEPPQITSANIPTETEFNRIQWDSERTLAPVKGVDNIVHDGMEKHEESSPESCFVSTLCKIEADVMNKIRDGLSRFSRVVVTADHGSSRLSVIAKREGKAEKIPWKSDEEPLNWRYTKALKGVQRPEECESQYHPDSNDTYWVVREYHRFPKKGGKKYALHGGASLEERLVPVLIFSKNNDANKVVAKQSVQKQTAELKDEFEGII